MGQPTKTFMQHLFQLRHEGLIERDLTTLLHCIATACKAIANHLKNGDLGDALGSLETENVQGETQKKLDVIANEIFLERCQYSGVLAGMVSEEMEDIQQVPDDMPKGRYVLLFDPLDGSSNIDVNVSVGSIFSILRLPDVPDRLTPEDVLRPGNEQVAAGYSIYGPSTMFVLSTGHGVHAFTFDGSIGEFRQTHTDVKIPSDTSEIAINASRRRYWDEQLRAYIDDSFAGRADESAKDYNMRWIASMVAEVHRILLRGGVFIYPVDSKNMAEGGKLRLLYEANPMSYLVENAGGAAIDGHQRILDIVPSSLHQRTGVMLGSADEIMRLSGRLSAQPSSANGQVAF